MITLKRLLLPVILICIFFAISGKAFAKSNLQATVNTSDPLKPFLTLTNISSEPCQVVKTNIGAISVAKVIQNGKEISPIPIDVAFDEGLDMVLARNLQTLNPNETIQIPLEVVPYNSGSAIQSITWSASAGAFGILYPLESNKPYTLEVTYDAPITVNDGAPLCGIASSSSTSSTSNTSSLFLIAIAIFIDILILIILIVCLLLWRKKMRRSAVTAMLLVISLLIFSRSASPAHAEYSVPDSASTQFNECMATLREHSDITGPILDQLDGLNIEIVPTDNGTNDTVAYPDGSYRIYWDPDHTYNYYSDDDGGPIVSTPCDRLFHEMFHVHDIQDRTFSRDLCADSNIETKEVMATRAQNRLREALGLRPRTHYGRDRIPPGDCSAPPPPPPCMGGCGMTNGDPHMQTFDKVKYDFMAAGEFVLARNQTGDFEVQVRQQPWEDSRIVSLTTSVAMKADTDRVEFQMRDQKLQLLVNGNKTDLTSTKLNSGITITPSGITQAIVSWTDGSSVRVKAIGGYGLYVVVDPVQSMGGKLEGILGNFNGNPDDDLKLRGTDTSFQAEFEKLYPAFADSWRIDDKTSLFTYDQNFNTETYTDKTFPDQFASAKDLPNRAVAESLCRQFGVADPDLLENCILDVALTGRPEFAQTASTEQLITNQPITKTIDYGGQKWDLKIDKIEDTASVEFDGKAGDKIFLDVSNTTLPDQCGILTLTDPNKKEINTGCIIGGRGMIDGTILSTTGKYKITLDPVNNQTGIGTATLQLITIKDQEGTITPDGKSEIANIDKPGVVAEFSFNGEKDQNIFVDIQTSTLPDQCGGFGIKNSAGEVIATGCIISSKGYIDTIKLPDAGEYKVFIDPSQQNVGKATLHLISSQDERENITLNDPPVTINLDKPGSSTTLTFSGTKGQRVYVDVPSSTLPDQCGGFFLGRPDGSSIDSGCIISHKGGLNDDGVILPETGDYIVTLDPADRNTGQATIHVHL